MRRARQMTCLTPLKAPSKKKLTLVGELELAQCKKGGIAAKWLAAFPRYGALVSALVGQRPDSSWRQG